jgi:hypothetical protein
MAEKNKSIIESALLDAKRIQEALNANTKEILRSVAIEEIDGLVKESLEEGFVEEDAEETDVEVSDDESTEELGDVKSSDEEEGEESEEGEELELDDEDSVEGDDLEGGDEFSMSAVALGGDDKVKDMTAAPMDDVIKVYKELTGDDEIEVVIDDESGDVKLTVNQPGTYVIKTENGDVEVSDDDELEIGGFEDEEVSDEAEYNEFEDESEEGESEEVMYEIELDNIDTVMNEVEGGETEEGEIVDETIAVVNGYAGRQGAKKSGSANLGFKNESVEKYNTLLTEAKELRGRNEEYKEALKQFRTMLAETVVFNSNLTYVTKLFMEHSTTKEEKQSILKRFDNEVSTLKESKKLYRTIVSELSSKKTMNESINKKINNEVSSSMSKQLNESTAYIDKETQRIKDLMSRVEKR